MLLIIIFIIITVCGPSNLHSHAHTLARVHTHTSTYVRTVNDIDYNSHHSLQRKSHDLGPNAIMGSVPLPAVCFSQLLLLLHAVFKSMFIKVQSVLERLC